MKKICFALLLVLLLTLALGGCRKKCVHTWQEATCTSPKTCQNCRATEGVPLSHTYLETVVTEANCQQDGIKRFNCQNCSDTYDEPFTYPKYDASEVYEKAKNSVGEIITYNKSGTALLLGSCFVYSADGKIVTNYHVIEYAYSAEITINNQTYPVTQVLAYDKKTDLAVLKVEASNLPVLKICKESHAVGKPIFALGSSSGLTATFSQGIITYAEREVDGVQYVQHDAAVSNGNSGGPLINQHCEVIGINSWGLKNSQNLNFAVAVSELDSLLYDFPVTLTQLYETQNNAFSKLKKYVLQQGSCDISTQRYGLTLGYSYSGDYSAKYTREIIYDLPKNQIELCLYVNNDYTLTIVIDEIDGVYGWGYSDKNNHSMIGTLSAKSYLPNSQAPYNYCNAPTSMHTSINETASSMISIACSYLDHDLAAIGLTAEDLGFLYY